MWTKSILTFTHLMKKKGNLKDETIQIRLKKNFQNTAQNMYQKSHIYKLHCQC